MKVLITGGAGFKGVVLAEKLQSIGHQVAVVDTFRWGVQPIVHLANRVEFVRGDVRHGELMRKLVADKDLVINLAGIVGYPLCERYPKEAHEVNVDSVYTILSGMSKKQMFIHASTGSVYGKLEETCTETSSTNPLTVYGRTNLESEAPVLDFGGVVLRFATAFGVSPCMRFDLLPNFFIWRALNDGFIVLYEADARRTLIDVKDMARAYLFSADRYQQMKGEIWNVGDESLNVTKREVAKKACDLVGAKLFVESVGQDKDARDYEVSYQKIRGIGFQCKHGLEEGLQQILVVARLVEPDNAWRIG